MNAYAPNGMPILGTLERIEGRAEIQEGSFTRKRGKLTFEWQGGTEVFWDGQRTVEKKRKGELVKVFLDEEGNEWTEDQITVREEK